MILMKFLYFLLFLSSYPALAADSLSYSGRLVNTDGSPVTGSVILRFDLVYTSDTTTILCTTAPQSVPLTKGVFHTKLDFTCPSSTLAAVISATDPADSVAIRVVDTTNSKTYSYQALHTMPFSVMASMAKTLTPLTPSGDVGKVLQWNGTAWIPTTLGAGTGTMTSINTGTGLTGGPITTTGTISIASGGVGTTQIADNSVTDIKINTVSRSKVTAGTANQIVVNDSSGNFSSVATVPLTQGGTGASSAAGARSNLGLGNAATATIGYTSGNVMPGDGVPTCFSGYKLNFTGMGPTWWACIAEDGNDNSKLPLVGGTMVGNIAMSGYKVSGLGTPTATDDAATKSYVDSAAAAASPWTVASGDIYRATGRVGIGTTTPSYQLQNATASGTAKDLFLSGVTGLTNGFGIQYDGTTTGNYMKYYFLDGNVGIGTTTPQNTLTLGSPIITQNLTGSDRVYSSIGAQTNQSNFHVGSIKFIQPNNVFQDAGALAFYTAFGSEGERMRINEYGSIGIGLTGPTAYLHLKAGTAQVNSAPLKFNSGINMTTPEAGAVEFDGTNLYFTDNTNTRKTLATSTGTTTFQPVAGSAGVPSYSFSGDSNTGFYSAGPDVIGVSTGGTEIFSFGANGLASTTQGGGAVSTANGTASSPTFSFAGDADTGWFRPAADTLAASTAGTERVRIDSNGNVGIGTSAPAAKLEVAGTLRLSGSSQQSIDFQSTGGSWSPSSQLYFNDLNGDGANTVMRFIARNGGGAAETFRTGGNGSGQIISSFPLGNVGIGTSTPASPLEIGLPGSGTPRWNFTSGSDNPRLDAYRSTGGASDYYGYRLEGVVGALAFSTASGNPLGSHTFVERMRLDINGRMGVGTSSPGSKLYVSSDSTDSAIADITAENTATGTPGMTFFKAGARRGTIALDPGDGYKMKFAATSSTPNFANDTIMTLDNNAYVGIGVQTPMSRLAILGPGEIAAPTVGASKAATLTLVATDNIGGYGGGVEFGGKNGQTFSAIKSAIQDGTTNGIGTLSIYTRNAVGDAAMTERMKFVSTGQIGVGVANPTASLHLKASTGVSGSAPLKLTLGTNLTTPEAGAIEYDGTNVYFTDNSGVRRTLSASAVAGGALTASTVYGGSAASGNLVLDSTSDSSKGNVILAPSGGNVGIGTNSPLGMLSNSATNRSDQNLIGLGTMALNWTGVSQGYVAGFENISTGNGFNGVLVKTADTTEYTAIFNAMSGLTSKFLVRGDGNVGIGTSTPGYPLSISSSSPVISLFDKEYNPADASSMGKIAFGSNIEYASIEALRQGTSYDDVSNIAFRTSWAPGAGGPGSNIERMRIQYDGNVGIGTDNPLNLLDMRGSSVNSKGLSITNAAATGSYPFVTLSQQGTSGSGIVDWANASVLEGSASGGLVLSSIYSPFKVQTGGSRATRFLVDPLGNVGVGTTTPSAKLHVTGTASFNAGAGATSVIGLGADQPIVGAPDASIHGTSFISSTVTNVAGLPTDLSFYTTTGGFANPRMTITPDGNVGIGTQNPTQKLQVVGRTVLGDTSTTSTNGRVVQVYTGNIGNADAGLDITRGDNSTYATADSQLSLRLKSDSGGSYRGAIGFSANNTAQETITLLNSGNVGIGTATPTDALNVNGAIRAGLRVTGNNSMPAMGSPVYFSGGSSVVGDDNTDPLWISRYDVTPNSSQLRFNIGDDPTIPGSDSFVIGSTSGITWYPKFTVEAAGNVGIGTTSPRASLDVAGQILAGNYSNSTNPASIAGNSLEVGGATPDATNMHATILFHHHGAFAHQLRYTDRSLYLEAAGNGYGTTTTPNFLVGGSIGIGNTTPSEKLEVTGNVKATAYLYTSDRRLKSDIKPVINSLEKINKLQGVTFKWKDSGEKSYGFIAQDVEKVAPELVKTDSKSTFKSVHYGNMISIVVEAFKEYFKENNREVASLKEENRKLKTKLESLEQRLERLERSEQQKAMKK
jgi:Chaperone of endosialidase